MIPGIELTELISVVGILGIAAIIFSESGLLLGFFLPGDTLLFAAGFFASQGHFSLTLLLFSLSVAAILGYFVGYHIGYHIGPRLFKKQATFLKHEYVEKAEVFYAKHGGKAILLARFVPIMRTLAPVMAGVAKMPARAFWFYNIAGGLLWIFSVTMLGYVLGERIPNIDQYLLPIVLGVIILSFTPTLVHLARDKAVRTAILRKFRIIRQK